MVKETVTYTDFNDVTRTEDFYFNLSRAELLKLQNSRLGGLDAVIKRISQEENNVELFKIFEEILLMSVGYKSDDGKRFVKTPEYTKAFSESEAFSELMVRLFNAGEAAKFFSALANIPADQKQQIANVAQTFNP